MPAAPAMAGRLRPGIVAALAVLLLYGGIALAIDVPKATFGFHSDEATYYLIGQSLAQDFDLEYRQEDLARTFGEYPSGPSGAFLKQSASGETDRLFFGKAYVYPLFASPFVKLFGTNGFFVFNALLVAGVVLAAYAFLSARSSRTVSLLLSLAFVFATIVPAYALWIAPEVFNFAFGAFAYFCWLYKEVAPEGRSRWLRDARSDYVAAVILGILVFSKVTNAAMFLPLLAWLVWKRQWVRAAVCTALVVAVTLAFFGVNIATAGEWNYQGGERRTFYPKGDGQPGYPFERPGVGIEVGHTVARDSTLFEVIFDRELFFRNFTWNTVYTFVGRHAGLVPYFFPAVLAMVAFLRRPRARPLWQWLVLLSCLMQIFGIMVSQPYTWNGSGGSVGNRYFVTAYGLFLFLMPPIRSLAAGVLPWFAGALFCWKIVLHPFYSSFHPQEHTWSGPLRVFPVELTLVNDLPMNTDLRRVRILFGQDPRFQLYYLDDNSFFREPGDWFWIRGRSRAEVLVKVAEPVRQLRLELQAGPKEVSGAVSLGRQSHRYTLAPGASTTVTLETGSGFVYGKDRTLVWHLEISADDGFTPSEVEPGNQDARFLGVRVRPVLIR